MRRAMILFPVIYECVSACAKRTRLLEEQFRSSLYRSDALKNDQYFSVRLKI